MKRTAIAIALTALLPSCGASFGDLLGAVVAADPVPLRIRALCSPLFRDADIQAIVIEINAARDEGTTKATAIASADLTCMNAADELLMIQDEEDPQIDALSAAQFEVDCLNCYVAMIDALYD